MLQEGMIMNRIIVCVKPVPDPKHWDKVSMDPETKTLKREGIPNIMNPLDKHALEAALALRESWRRSGSAVNGATLCKDYYSRRTCDGGRQGCYPV